MKENQFRWVCLVKGSRVVLCRVCLQYIQINRVGTAVARDGVSSCSGPGATLFLLLCATL